MKALTAGKHLVTEQPLARTLEQANDICVLAEERGLTVLCAPPTC